LTYCICYPSVFAGQGYTIKHTLSLVSEALKPVAGEPAGHEPN
jgi:hypothetical protein